MLFVGLLPDPASPTIYCELSSAPEDEQLQGAPAETR